MNDNHPLPVQANPLIENDGLWYGRIYDLKVRYPISFLFVVKKLSVSLAIFSAALILFLILYSLTGFQEVLAGEASYFQYALYTFLRLGIVAILLQGFYWETYRNRFEYFIDGFRLHVNKGVFSRSEGSVALIHQSEVYIKQSIVDLLLGIYEVNVYSPLDDSRKYSLIEGLRKKDARTLRDFLVYQLNKQVSVANAPGLDKKSGKYFDPSVYPK
jgi:uncharacterized membrane protein YdbT with pleckstrin-like domain